MILRIVGALSVVVSIGAALEGDVVGSFTLEGMPSLGVRGLAKDWQSGGIWAVGIEEYENVKACRFNSDTHVVELWWFNLEGATWGYDAGYGYKVGVERVLLVVDSMPPRLKMFNTKGNYIGYFREPWNEQMLSGVDCDWSRQMFFVSHYNAHNVGRWDGSWILWVEGKMPFLGLAEGWNRLYGVSSSLYIYEYDNLYGQRGNMLRHIKINMSERVKVVGLSIGRENGWGNEETLFVASYFPVFAIYEVSIGNLNNAIEPSSLGRIKFCYK